MSWNNGEMVWTVIFTRSFHDWELGSLQVFFDYLYSHSFDWHMEDRMCWVPEKSGLFAVKSYYKILIGGGVYSLPWKIFGRWKFLIGWLSLLGQQLKGKILILDNLKTRNIYVVNWCCMCENSEDLLHDIFFFLLINWITWQLVVVGGASCL